MTDARVLELLHLAHESLCLLGGCSAPRYMVVKEATLIRYWAFLSRKSRTRAGRRAGSGVRMMFRGTHLYSEAEFATALRRALVKETKP